jgi:hypothetical protein
MSPHAISALPQKRKKPDDRRRSDRKPHVMEAWIASPTASDSNAREEVRSINVSRHGVGFQSDKVLPIGAFYVLDVVVGEQQLNSEVRIISCRAIENSLYEIGAAFC